MREKSGQGLFLGTSVRGMFYSISRPSLYLSDSTSGQKRTSARARRLCKIRLRCQPLRAEK